MARNKWYRENQELVDAHSDRMKQQAATIVKLRADNMKSNLNTRGNAS